MCKSEDCNIIFLCNKETYTNIRIPLRQVIRSYREMVRTF